MNTETKKVVVAGDVTVDWHITRVQKGMDTGEAWSSEEKSRAFVQPGGAALVGSVIATLMRSDTSWCVSCPSFQPEGVCPGDPRFHHSYALWKPQEYLRNAKTDADRKRRVWRVDQSLGLDNSCDWKKCAPHHRTDDPIDARIVVLDDAGLCFGSECGQWPKAITEGSPKWIIIKTSHSIDSKRSQPLWDALSKHKSKTIAVVNVNDLRRASAQISMELSWERTAQDTYREITRNPAIRHLSLCTHVIVSYGPAGALLISNASAYKERACTLLFDQSASEGSWEKQYSGYVIGYNTCLVAAITKQVASCAPPNMSLAVQAGVRAMQELLKNGFGDQIPDSPLDSPRFPTELVTKTIEDVFSSGKTSLGEARVPEPSAFGSCRTRGPGRHCTWTILDDVCAATDQTTAKGRPNLQRIAMQIVNEGCKEALKDVPLASFGKLKTADIREIEAYRSTNALMSEYCQNPQKKPLSIGVFGPPGCGKSFGVKQIAASITETPVQDCTFNVSQFHAPSELVDALHQVRDIGLSGKMPLVFWDEFDSSLGGNKLGWLRYFLAPMQDGQFQDGQVTHHIGRAIFVFAGGTAWRMAEFGKGMKEDEFKEVKGPDFVSRLQGFIDVIGPNPIRDAIDDHYMVRRAIMLRDMLERVTPNLIYVKNDVKRINIDQGVLNAFLKVSEYRHGARSMESIVSTSLLSGKCLYERSCLPSESQLNLHVNGAEFLALIQEPQFDVATLENAAKVVHEHYRKAKLARPQLDVPYAELEEPDKEENRRLVLGTPEKLRSIGYVMVPMIGSDGELKLSKKEIDALAEEEHMRWMCSKISNGWTYGKVDEPDKIKKKHPYLLHWSRMSKKDLEKLDADVVQAIGPGVLSDAVKRIDVAMIKAITSVLKEVKYTAVYVGGGRLLVDKPDSKKE